jgi:DNA (cytosine-5)-methyltransferase 1
MRKDIPSNEPRAAVPVIDLFAGPGGLGEGFSAFQADGAQPFKIHLSIEKDAHAHETLRLRSFYRQFCSDTVPNAYYDVLRGRSSIQTLFTAHPLQAQAARRESWKATLGLVPRGIVNGRIRTALAGADRWVLIGGPPCQAYSVAGRARNNGNEDYRAEKDHRQYLYVEYLQVIADHWPAIFVMENVKGLLSASVNDRQMFQRILEDLSSPQEALRREQRTILPARRQHTYRVLPLTSRNTSNGIEVGDYVVAAEKHGIPQARHRVILVGVRDDLGDVTLPSLPESAEIPVSRVLEGLPRLRSGLSKRDSEDRWFRLLAQVPDRRWLASAGHNGGAKTERAILSTLFRLTLPKRGRGRPFIEGDFAPQYAADWYMDGKLDGICHHETRSHIDKDLHRYLFVSGFGKAHGRSPILKEFPKDLLPAHDNVEAALKDWGNFNDRFRVQVRDKPASTVTSHIAKDGHYYIHYDPSQCRSLTLREAARLQTFPDNYYFCGPRTEGYGQVGNAVPPLLAREIARSVWEALKKSGIDS